jgi:penicillin-binding protein 1A
MALLDMMAGAFRGRPALTTCAVLPLAVALWTVGVSGAWFTADVTFGLPGRETLRTIGDLAQSTTIFDARDRRVFTIFREQRIEVPLSRVSPHMVQAVLAIEDQRFYDHRGIDIIRVGAAALANLKSGRRAQGGSTITQQLARQSLLTRDKTFRRKLKEVLLAAQIEETHSKDEILEIYLNKVYFGDGFHGVEAAALGYFGKHAADLNIAEAALLAGLIQSPSAYSPTAHPARALGRRNVVLAAMREMGIIDPASHAAAHASRIALHNSLQREEPFGLYFKELVRRELVDRFGWERVSEGGLKVYTTIDADLQPRVEAAVEESLRSIEGRRGYAHMTRAGMTPPAEDAAPDYLQAAVMVMDVETGEVRALTGGRDFQESHFNRATQARRQPGSAFKPFVYAAALEQGMTPASVLTSLDDPVLTAQGEWMPEDEHSAAESMTLRTALRTSSNRAAVRLLRTVGIKRAVGYISQFDLGQIPPVPSLALGAGEVTLASMTSAFGAFSNGGVLRKPIYIRRVEDRDGNVVYRADYPSRQVVSPVTAFLLSNMLADVINSGTAWKARAAGFTLPAAGKTGTTNEYRDVWFVGYTPRIVAGVWMGFDQPKPIMANGYAGELAVPLWARVMRAATEGDEPAWLPRPDGVTAVQVCRVSGRLPDEGCSAVEVMRDDGTLQTRSMVYTEYFRRGTAPGEVCDLHPGRSWLRRVADVFDDDGRSAARASELALPPPVAGDPTPAPVAAVEERPAASTEAEAAASDEKPKKRGFWSRLFGRREKPAAREKEDNRSNQRREGNASPEERREERSSPPRPR